MHYKKVIVYICCQPILARVDNCNWIFIHKYIEWQIKVIVYTFCQSILQDL